MEKATQEEIKEYHRLREKYGKFQETIALKVYYIQKKMFLDICKEYHCTPSELIRDIISEIIENKKFKNYIIKALGTEEGGKNDS